MGAAIDSAAGVVSKLMGASDDRGLIFGYDTLVVIDQEWYVGLFGMGI